MEVDLYSALPGIQYFCEQAFGAADPMKSARAHFAGTCGCAFDPWVKAAGVDSIPPVKKPALAHTALGRALLWQDPALALLDPVLGDRVNLRPWYGRLAASLSAEAARGGLASRLEYPAALASVLELKVHLRRDLAAAYAAGDRRTMAHIVTREMPELRRRATRLWKRHRRLWMDTYAPFGWEVMDSRYGTLMARLETLRLRMRDYLAGRLDGVAEMEATLIDPWKGADISDLYFSAARMRTPSCIK